MLRHSRRQERVAERSSSWILVKSILSGKYKMLRCAGIGCCIMLAQLATTMAGQIFTGGFKWVCGNHIVRS